MTTGFASYTLYICILSTLLNGCAAPGEIIRAEPSQPRWGYPYSYRVYLPPCFSADTEARYPILYLVPGRSSAPDAWFAAGLAEVTDRLILSVEIPPLIIVTTENIESDPLAEIIYEELIPSVETQYPIADDRIYRAVAGGLLGGIAAYRLAYQHPGTFFGAGIFGAGAISREKQQIEAWLSSLDDTNRIRVFMDGGDKDIFMLARAEVMKTVLDEAGIENQLHIRLGGHNYAYWVGNLEMYLKWMTRDW
ncbi:MAG TPA: alpha/beta hydrolase-fold protein [Anaerolineales bacterium]|nr:alpha/beta hydrolase-fold protein [Anaerolineales bacterium]